MNPTIEKLRVLQIIDSMAFLTRESLDRIIAVAEYELRARADEERFDQDYDDMLHGRTNALEGIE